MTLKSSTEFRTAYHDMLHSSNGNPMREVYNDLQKKFNREFQYRESFLCVICASWRTTKSCRMFVTNRANVPDPAVHRRHDHRDHHARKPNLKNIPNDTGCPFVAQMPAVTRFAPAPTSVPLPPKQAPKASTHASV